MYQNWSCLRACRNASVEPTMSQIVMSVVNTLISIFADRANDSLFHRKIKAMGPMRRIKSITPQIV